MKKLVFLSLFTPTVLNIKGPSSLLYNLLKYREKNIEVICYSFNLNKINAEHSQKIEKELQIKIINIPFNAKYKFAHIKYIRYLINKYYKFPLGSFLDIPYSIYKEINAYNPNGIILYPHWLIKIAKRMKGFKNVVIGPDSSALHYDRCIKDKYVYLNNQHLKKYSRSYLKNLRLENEWAKMSNCLIAFVGKDDLNFYTRNSGKNAFFFRHPHNEFTCKPNNINEEKLTILISGNYNIYTYTDSLNFVNFLEEHPEFANYFKITFLGGGWEAHLEKLRNAHFNCEYLEWVENYFQELLKYDIQLFPISVGTGTKGKVLDALSMGLLCVGSEYAFENIDVKNEQSCVQYSKIEDVICFMNEILKDKQKYLEIAKNGQNRVLKSHNPKICAEEFYKKVNDFFI